MALNINYDELRQNILNEHNRLLTDPQSYIPTLDKYLSYFKGDVLRVPNQKGLQTKEGPEAFIEAKKFLESLKPFDSLTYDQRLFRAANDHLNDIGPKGLFTHEGSDGSTVSERIERYCEWEGTCVQNVDFGGKTAVDVIISLLVDDGMEGRPHRKNMFSKDLKYIGVAVGDHKESGVVTIITYVGGMRDLGKPFFDTKTYKYQYPANLDSKAAPKKKEKNSLQAEDDDAPDGAVSVKITKSEKEFNGKKHWATKKTYTMKDGTQQIIEIEDF